MATRDRSPEARPPRASRKDRLIQTRVPQDLETTLKQEAQRRRLSVSHLIRNILEDTFQLVDGVVTEVDHIVSESASLAKHVRRTAQRLASPGRRTEPLSAGSDTDLSHVYAWNEVVLNHPATCSCCDVEIHRGERGFAGLSDQPDLPREWLCRRCAGDL
jgi:hypothetical protein